MENQGAVIDIGQGTVSFKAIGVEDLPLLRASKGHLAILDYPLGAIPDNQTAGPARRSTAPPPAEGGHHDLTEEELAEIMEAYNEYEVPEGWDPDSWAEHFDFIETMRQEVEDWENGEMDGDVSEDVNYFEEVLINEPALTKRATNKKWKKLQAMMSALDGDDWRARRVLSGKTVTSKRPPFGKTWMKQLFAGQMGLTLLQLGRVDFPRQEARQQRRAMGCLEVLVTVNRVIRDRVKARRRVLVEQPRDSEWLAQPEMSDVRQLLEEGVLVRISADGCQVGYMDSDTGLPYLL